MVQEHSFACVLGRRFKLLPVSDCLITVFRDRVCSYFHIRSHIACIGETLCVRSLRASACTRYLTVACPVTPRRYLRRHGPRSLCGIAVGPLTGGKRAAQRVVCSYRQIVEGSESCRALHAPPQT